MELFIALTFHENDLNYKIIDSFRSRFDYKYSRSPLLLMSLMSPFVFKNKNVSKIDYTNIVDWLRDDIDNFLMGFDDDFEVKFNGFDFFSGRKGVIYLKPELPSELSYFKETASVYLRESGAIFKREEKLEKLSLRSEYTFLPIARSSDQELLSHGVRTAQIEFSSPFTLHAKEVALFEKVPGQWICRSILHKFKESEKGFENSLREKRLYENGM